jgi:hypothetical protein
MSQTKVAEKIKTHFTFNNFFWKSCRLWDYVEKYGRARQETNEQYGARALHAGYLSLQTHTQNSNNYGFSTATMVTRTRLNVTLRVHSLSCLYWFLGPVILEIIMYLRNLSKSGRGKNFFLFTKTFLLPLGRSQPPTYMVRGFFLWGKVAGAEISPLTLI